METIHEKLGDVRVIRLIGRLDIAAAPELESTVASFIGAGENKLVFDCAELTYVSSSGLAAFVKAAKTIGGQGQVAFASLNQHVGKVFEMTGFYRIFATFSSREDAVGHLTRLA
jgi:anti-sigma B factor antagonist